MKERQRPHSSAALRLSLAAIFLFLPGLTLQAETVDLTARGAGEYVTRQALHVEDRGGKAGFAAVRSADTRWAPLSTDIAGYGYTRAAHWFLLDFARSPTDHRRLVVNFWHIHVDHIDIAFYDRDGRALSVVRAGDALPVDATQPRTRSFTVELPETSRFTMLVREESTNSLIFAPTIWEEQALMWVESRDQLLMGIVLGFIALMILYNLLMYGSTRYPGYAWYAVYLFAMGSFQVVYTGIGRIYLWPARALQNALDIPSLALLIGASLAFAWVTNRLREVRGMTVACWLFVAVDVAGLALGVWGLRRPALFALNGLLVVMTALTFVGVLIQAARGRRFSRLFALAWAVVLGSGLYSGISSLGLLHDLRSATIAVLLGILFEIVVLSFNFADTVYGLQRTVNSQLQRIMRSEHLAAVGTAAASIAHEVNNPNHVIAVNASLLARMQDLLSSRIREAAEDGALVAPDDPVVEDFRERAPTMIEDIRAAADRISGIVEWFRTRSAALTADSVHCDLRAQIEEVMRLNESVLRKASRFVEVSVPPVPVMVTTSPLRIQQLVTNLVMNAAQSLESRDRGVTVSLAADGAQAVLAVKDQGRGMDRVTLQRLGEPFLSTRHGAGGSGLGLMICFEIVRELDGTLRFESTPGRGTTAIVTLPMAGRPA